MAEVPFFILPFLHDLIGLQWRQAVHLRFLCSEGCVLSLLLALSIKFFFALPILCLNPHHWLVIGIGMQLNTEVEAIEAERRAQQPAVQVLEIETKELENEIQALNKQHGALQSDIRALKQEGLTVAEEVTCYSFFPLSTPL